VKPGTEQDKKPAADEAAASGDSPAEANAAPPATPTGLEGDDSVEIEFISDEPEEGIELVEDPPEETSASEPEPAVEEAPASAEQQRIASLTRLVARSRIEMDLVQGELGGLKKERAELQKEVREKDDRMVRAQADFAAVRAQLERKLEEQVRNGPEAMIRELMTVVDHLDLALRTSAKEDPLYQGIEMTRSELLNILKRNGAEPVEAVGAPFNPRFHEATSAEYQEGLTVDTVIDDLRRGWQRGGKVLRPTLARVGKPPAG
jgi:molecular chaperone GrpE